MDAQQKHYPYQCHVENMKLSRLDFLKFTLHCEHMIRKVEFYSTAISPVCMFYHVQENKKIYSVKQHVEIRCWPYVMKASDTAAQYTEITRQSTHRASNPAPLHASYSNKNYRIYSEKGWWIFQYPLDLADQLSISD